MDGGDMSHFGPAGGRNRTASMDHGQLPVTKRGRSGSISGRLRAASDLEEIGWIDKSQKGIIKDLIISGDQTLRNALDKYENGDAGDLEVLIQRGMLARRQSLDLLDGLDMDFLTVGYGAQGEGSGYPYEDDFFFGQEGQEGLGQGLGQGGSEQEEGGIAYTSDLFSYPSSSSSYPSWQSRRSSSIGTSLGGGSFDLGGAFFEGLGGNLLPPSCRKHSLSLPSSAPPHSTHLPLHPSHSTHTAHPPAVTTPRSGFIAGMGSGGEVDMSAYQSMAASLQAQGQGQPQHNVNGRISSKTSSSPSPSSVPSSSKGRETKGSTQKQVPVSAPKKGHPVNVKTEGGPPNTNPPRGGGGGGGRYSGPTPGTAIDTHSQHQHQQQMDRELYSQQQHLQQQQHQRQQQLAEMQHNLMVRQMHLSGGRQQHPHPILSHPHGHIHASHSHVHYAPYEQPFYPQGAKGQVPPPPSLARMFPLEEGLGGKGEGRGGREGGYSGGILSSLYSADGTLLDATSLPLGGRGYVGAYSPEARRERIERFLAKRDKRVWTKKVKYDVRKNFADSRLRVKGRFVKKEDEELMKELLSI